MNRIDDYLELKRRIVEWIRHYTSSNGIKIHEYWRSLVTGALEIIYPKQKIYNPPINDIVNIEE